MAWANCPTHGPIQDASVAEYGDEIVFTCSCGLVCEPYQPEAFVEHEELKELAKTDTQPKPKAKPKAKAKAGE